MLKRFSEVNLQALGFEFTHLAEKDDGYVFFENEKPRAYICIQKCNIEEENGIFLRKPVFLNAKSDDKITSSFLVAAQNDFPTHFIALGETEKSYENLGFEYTFGYRYLTKESEKGLFHNAEFDTITANTLYNLRQRFIEQPLLNVDKQDYVGLITNLYASGASTVIGENGYAIYYRKKENIVVREFFAQSEEDAINILKAISNHDSRDFVELYLPEISSLFCGEGKKVHCGMIKNCSKKNIFNGIIEV